MRALVPARLKVLLPLSLLLVSLSRFAGAEEPDKYRWLGATDADLAFNMRKVPDVILGSVYKAETKKLGSMYHVYIYQVKVIECYKGALKPGEKIQIVVMAETGPAPEEEIGKQRYYLLTPGKNEGKTMKGSFVCEWTDSLSYEEYGKAPRNAFLNAPKVEIGVLDELLKPSEHRKGDEGDYGDFSPTPAVRWQTILSVRWISRAELLARKHYWQDCLAHNCIHGDIADAVESFQFLDTSVCEYRQEIENPEGGVDFVGNEYLPEGAVWKRWVPPDKGFDLFNKFVVELPKAAQSEPTETSLCVIMSFISNGKFMVQHFYLPSRFPIHTLLHEARKTGVDCSNWEETDARWATPAWMAQKLKYNTKIWYE